MPSNASAKSMCAGTSTFRNGKISCFLHWPDAFFLRSDRSRAHMGTQGYAFEENCAFCKIVRNDEGLRVFEDEHTIAFLDHRPLFPGHCLLIPRSHFETIQDLPDSLLAPLFANVQCLPPLSNRACARKAHLSPPTIASAKAYRISTCTLFRVGKATA